MQKRAILAITIATVLFTTLIGFLSVFQNVSAESDTIPNWIKNTAKWWSENQVNDGDFSNEMKFLINDNYDSIVYNLAQILGKIGVK